MIYWVVDAGGDRSRRFDCFLLPKLQQNQKAPMEIRTSPKLKAAFGLRGKINLSDNHSNLISLGLKTLSLLASRRSPIFQAEGGESG